MGWLVLNAIKSCSTLAAICLFSPLIVKSSPAVEAGEKLGFLPGDMNEKIDPYLRPIYDALYEMLGFDKVEKLLNKNIIEVAPLAFMRGRTLNEAFIILEYHQAETPIFRPLLLQGVLR
jgi:phosphate starvation-inducible PhoH-like protein